MACRTEGVCWRKHRLGKRKKCFILLQKHKKFTWTIRPQDTLRFYIVCKHYQQHTMAPMADRQTLRHCDLEQALGWGHLVCEKATWGMESSVSTFTVLYRTSPILLTFNILQFFYENPYFPKTMTYSIWHTQ